MTQSEFVILLVGVAAAACSGAALGVYLGARVMIAAVKEAFFHADGKH